MSQITITETCCCGARFEGTGYMSYIMAEVDKFREAHAVCRERLSEPVGPWLLPLPTDVHGEEQ